MRSKNCTGLWVILVVIAGYISSCKKNFLDKKPSSDLVVPTTLEDFQALLDNDIVMRETPVLGELSADNLYLDSTFWGTIDTKEHNAYIWARDIYENKGNVDDWGLPYQQVFYANVVLDGLPGVAVDSTNRDQWNALKGAAYFIRAYAFWNVAQVFAPVYNSATATTDLGIPLRLTSDVNQVSTRASIKQTYDQILSDLQQASALLPEAIPFSNLNRPSKPAALAMLARVCLSMGEFAQAGDYANSCLMAYPVLQDYNSVTGMGILPFKKPNSEILYESHMLTSTEVISAFFHPLCIVDSDLYNSYTPNDLRKQVFYTVNAMGLPNIRGSYNVSIYPFTGLATDEVYLISAECFARAGNYTTAISTLNTLLSYRWATGTFVPYTATNANDALAIIMSERRKELAFRGLRWTDLRRMNSMGNETTLLRVMNGITYTLQPNSLRYVLPIPPDVIALSGMIQNPR
ncbi:MAG: RagB/SusD family nutrient uptake outer membrane protein [Bacteroidota bacterium]|nr:RagB/SusD family nutrient uptake outer membrane protein [Bacteroidota bacterium]MDP4247242.1 RagB/SusD family nutrient uptake outer membrane protein [Bacteroidota bacterium]MDP4254062.1 RagB/SusD family nutrient uptake outer membrane protein [Bacteroidota bacterium]MDP4258172.1 RagB/SusD family nutrient uptake outer membrane protein [Bacteroidota bacterium]